MEKKYIEKEVLHLTSQTKIPFKKFKEGLLDDDIIVSNYEEPYHSENNSCDGYYYVKVLRDVLETDAEFEKRIKKNEKFQKELKERRYQHYLSLKKEFENEGEGA